MKMIKKYWAVIVGLVAALVGLIWITKISSAKKQSDLNTKIKSNEKQVDIDEKNEFGMTALHMAMIKSNATAARYLIENRANPNATDKNGYTPLLLAVIHAKDMDIIELLLNRKEVDVNHSNDRGHNARKIAKYNKHGLGEQIINRLKEKVAVEIED